jgi:hypothetical protein
MLQVTLPASSLHGRSVPESALDQNFNALAQVLRLLALLVQQLSLLASLLVQKHSQLTHVRRRLLNVAAPLS